MTSVRSCIDATVGPGTEGLIGGYRRPLVHVRMFDDSVEHPEPDVLCYLSPHDARELASCLLASAEYADRQTSIPSSAGIPVGGRPPHAHNPQPPKQGEHELDPHPRHSAEEAAEPPRPPPRARAAAV